MGLRLALGGLLAALCCGCVVLPEPPAAQVNRSCLDEPTRPLTAADATRTLRRRGFTVRRDRGDVVCDAPAGERMPVSLTNIFFEGPHENIGAHDEVSEREGHVACGLRRAPIWGWKLDEDLEAPPASPIFSGDKATFSFANLECTLYPEGDRKEEQVRNLQRAVRELAALARTKRR